MNYQKQNVEMVDLAVQENKREGYTVLDEKSARESCITQIKELKIDYYGDLEKKSLRQLSNLLKRYYKNLSKIYEYYLKEKTFLE